ncbi:hypothetical protein BCR42DRAFT_97134 [Absidia repens]|uniref:DH domain-containing protein n=1 Tax=Absidia repens TaxID=90262 RepID=A0A1X2I8T3_9FUNG|nr:hypothetical protein BCR42DRAFT_97134 [Absidia repens]
MSSILSASTVTSSSSKAFSLSSTTSTSSTQYSAMSGAKTSQILLSDLLDSEATYINDLKIIDSKIAPLWMKQTTQAAPDFTELIKNIRDIILANKRFYMKLTKFVGNAHAARELGNILLQWVTDLEVPYSNYARSYIPNLNDREDILANRSITQLLKELSRAASYNISLDSLFSAPIQHLKYYQDFYKMFLNAEPNHPNSNDFIKASHYLEAILTISQEHLASNSMVSAVPPSIYTQPKSSTSTYKSTEKKKSFIGQDEDFFSYYTEAGELSPQGSYSDDRDSTLDDYGPSFVDNGYYAHDVKEYPAGGDDDLSTIQPRTVKILDAVPSEPKLATVVASTTTSSSPKATVDRSAQVQMTYIQPTTAKVIVLGDESIDDDLQQENNMSTTSHTKKTSESAPAPKATPILTPAKTPAPSPKPAPSFSQTGTVGATSTTPPPQKSLSPASNEPARPISPRAVQVQQAVNPVAAMQAVPQKTNDYFGISSNENTTKPHPARKESVNTNLPERSSSATPGATILPRTSSIKGSARNTGSTTPSTQQSTPPTKPNGGQSPILAHPHSPLSSAHTQPIGNVRSPQQVHALPLLRSSSLKSTEHLDHSTLPPRKDSNNPRPISSRSTKSPTMTPRQQQNSPQINAQYQQPQAPQPDDDQQNSVRQVIYSNNLCEVFHWKDQSWYAVDGQCTVQVRLTFGGRSNLAVQLQPSGQLYLNVWILPSMVVSQPSPTDISVSATMMEQQENYLIHFTHPTDASNLLAMLHRMHHESSRQPPPSSSSAVAPPPVTSASPLQRKQQPPRQMIRPEMAAVELRDDTPSVEDVPQTLKPVFQCKCKLFVQNETSKWNPMGSTAMRISHQLPSQKTHIYIEDDKNNLINSILRSGNVERLANKRITFLLSDTNDKSSMVYMIQLKDEQTGNKVFDYLKTQNAAHGW